MTNGVRLVAQNGDDGRKKAGGGQEWPNSWIFRTALSKRSTPPKFISPFPSIFGCAKLQDTDPLVALLSRITDNAWCTHGDEESPGVKKSRAVV